MRVLNDGAGDVLLIQFAKNILKGQRAEYQNLSDIYAAVSASTEKRFLAEISTGIDAINSTARDVVSQGFYVLDESRKTQESIPV